MATILDDPADVRGVIYCVEHIASGKRYVGQTRSHRLNHGRYRPFGAEGRFRDHISCAIRNTKTDQCSALYNDIRLHGRDAYRWSQLETCEVVDLDRREQHWIKELGALYPAGYNLTEGGRAGGSVIAHVGISTPLNPVGKRGGSMGHSAETRAKMAATAAIVFTTEAARAARAAHATAQHAGEKVKRFAEVSIDPTDLDQYIFTKGVRVFVRIGAASASFATKGATQEENKQRAKEFLLALKSTATLPNCSGNP